MSLVWFAGHAKLKWRFFFFFFFFSDNSWKSFGFPGLLLHNNDLYKV